LSHPELSYVSVTVKELLHHVVYAAVVEACETRYCCLMLRKRMLQNKTSNEICFLIIICASFRCFARELVSFGWRVESEVTPVVAEDV
jgi:hypothetical protein